MRRSARLLALLLVPLLARADLWAKLPAGTPHAWMRGRPVYPIGSVPSYPTSHAVDGYDENKGSETTWSGGPWQPEVENRRSDLCLKSPELVHDFVTHCPRLAEATRNPDPHGRSSPPMDSSWAKLCAAMFVAAQTEPPARMNPLEAVNFLVSLDTLAVPSCLACCQERRRKGPAPDVDIATQALERIGNDLDAAPSGAGPPDSWDASIRRILLDELSQGRYLQVKPFGTFLRENADRALGSLEAIAKEPAMPSLVRRNAAGFLSEMASPEALKSLRALAESSDAVIRTRSRMALILRQDPESLPMFRKSLEGGDLPDAALAAAALGAARDKASVPVLAKLWDEGEGRLSMSALGALSRIADPGSKDLLKKAARRVPLLAPVARAGLSRMASDRESKPRSIKGDIVYEDADWAPFDGVFYAFQVEAMASFPEGRDALWEDLIVKGSSCDILRAACLVAFPSEAVKAWADRIEALARNRRAPPLVRSAALARLWPVDPSRAAEAAVKVLEDPLDPPDWVLKRAALSCVPSPPPAAAFKDVRALASSEDPGTALSALWVLRDSPEPAVSRLMEGILEDGLKAPLELRLRAARLLGRRKERKPAEALAAALVDPEPCLRVQAALALEEATGRKAFADLLSTPAKDWKDFQKDWRSWIAKAKMEP